MYVKSRWSPERIWAPCCSGSGMTCCYISRLVELRFSRQQHCHSPQGSRYQSPQWLVRGWNNLSQSTNMMLSSYWNYETMYDILFKWHLSEREKKSRQCYACLAPAMFPLRIYISATKSTDRIRVWLGFELHNSNLEVTFKVDDSCCVWLWWIMGRCVMLAKTKGSRLRAWSWQWSTRHCNLHCLDAPSVFQPCGFFFFFEQMRMLLSSPYI